MIENLRSLPRMNTLVENETLITEVFTVQSKITYKYVSWAQLAALILSCPSNTPYPFIIRILFIYFVPYFDDVPFPALSIFLVLCCD